MEKKLVRPRANITFSLEGLTYEGAMLGLCCCIPFSKNSPGIAGKITMNHRLHLILFKITRGYVCFRECTYRGALKPCFQICSSSSHLPVRIFDTCIWMNNIPRLGFIEFQLGFCSASHNCSHYCLRWGTQNIGVARGVTCIQYMVPCFDFIDTDLTFAWSMLENKKHALGYSNYKIRW